MKAGLLFLSFLVGPVLTVSIQAGEVGHYGAGVPNFRDFVVPEPGFYGVLYVPWNFRYFYEFAAEDRFQGQSIGLNFAKKF